MPTPGAGAFGGDQMRHLGHDIVGGVRCPTEGRRPIFLNPFGPWSAVRPNPGPQQRVASNCFAPGSRSGFAIQRTAKPQSGNHAHGARRPIVPEHVLFKGRQRQWRSVLPHAGRLAA